MIWWHGLIGAVAIMLPFVGFYVVLAYVPRRK